MKHTLHSSSEGSPSADGGMHRRTRTTAHGPASSRTCHRIRRRRSGLRGIPHPGHRPHGRRCAHRLRRGAPQRQARQRRHRSGHAPFGRRRPHMGPIAIVRGRRREHLRQSRPGRRRRRGRGGSARHMEPRRRSRTGDRTRRERGDPPRLRAPPADHGRTWSPAEEITAAVKEPGWTWYATDRATPSSSGGAPCGAARRSGQPQAARRRGRRRLPLAAALVRRPRAHVEAGRRLAGRRQRKLRSRTLRRLAAAQHAPHRPRGQPPALARSADGGTAWCGRGAHPELIEPRCQGSLLNPRTQRPSHAHAALLQPARSAPAAQPLALREPRRRADMVPPADPLQQVLRPTPTSCASTATA